jgi:hypothetical protein
MNKLYFEKFYLSLNICFTELKGSFVVLFNCGPAIGNQHFYSKIFFK